MTRLSSSHLVLWLLSLCLSLPCAASTPVYFYYRANAILADPAVCTSGVLSCDLDPSSANNFTCTGLPNGTHVYYPGFSATDNSSLPSYAVPLNATFASPTSSASAPRRTSCSPGQTTSLPLTSSGAGLNAQYGQTCAYVYQGPTSPVTYNDVVTSVVDFRYSTDPCQLPTCPDPTPPTRTDLVTVGFTYVTNGTALLRGSPVGTILCGAANLACQALGASQYLCSSLTSGVQYRYNGNQSSPTYGLSSIPLTGLGSCYGAGDGYLPPTREGLSFLGPQLSVLNCTQLYRVGGAWTGLVSTSFSTILGATTFDYTEGGYSSLSAQCAAVIPGLGQSTSEDVSASMLPTAEVTTVMLGTPPPYCLSSATASSSASTIVVGILIAMLCTLLHLL